MFVLRDREREDVREKAGGRGHVCRYVRLFDSVYIQHTSTCDMFVCVFVCVCVGASREQTTA